MWTKALAFLSNWVSVILCVCGLILLSAGAFMLNTIVGVAFTGIEFIAAAVLIERERG